MNPYLNQPREVSIETLAVCNAACTFCPYPTLDRKGALMPTATLARLHEEMRDFTAPFFLSPFKVNEPFLDPRLKSFLQLVDEETPLARLRLFTNGQPLTWEVLEWVSKLRRVEHLWVSLNSTDPEEYRRLMSLDFNKTAKRLDYLHNNYRKFPHKVVLSRVAQSWPLGESDIRFARDCADRWPFFYTKLLKKDAWIDYTTPTVTEVPDKPCTRWEELSIMADGRVALCCMDGTGKYSIGNIRDNTLLEIYNSPGYRSLRLLSTRKRAGKPCDGCTY